MVGRSIDERKDFEPVLDPKLGAVPWSGEFEFGHPGARPRVRSSSRIKAGDRVLVSWYHPVVTVGSQVMCCLSEPKLDQILVEQARRVNDLFHPRTFFMSHDEIRVANWCKACRDRKMTPGAMLADNVRRCTQILKSLNPRARVVVWSDMFDPTHNAVNSYYLVNGSLKGSWEGLSRDVIIANWNGGKAQRKPRLLRWSRPSPAHRRLLRRRRPVQLPDVGCRGPRHQGCDGVHVYYLVESIRPARVVRQGPRVGTSALTRFDRVRAHRWRMPPAWRRMDEDTVSRSAPGDDHERVAGVDRCPD